ESNVRLRGDRSTPGEDDGGGELQVDPGEAEGASHLCRGGDVGNRWRDQVVVDPGPIVEAAQEGGSPEVAVYVQGGRRVGGIAFSVPVDRAECGHGCVAEAVPVSVGDVGWVRGVLSADYLVQAGLVQVGQLHV